MKFFQQRLAVGHTCDKCKAVNEVGCLNLLNGKPIYFTCQQCQEEDFQTLLVEFGVTEDYCVSASE